MPAAKAWQRKLHRAGYVAMDWPAHVVEVHAGRVGQTIAAAPTAIIVTYHLGQLALAAALRG